MKYILISSLVIFVSGCKEATYNTLDNFSKEQCRNIINAEDRLKCENKEKPRYKEYKKYYEEK